MPRRIGKIGTSDIDNNSKYQGENEEGAANLTGSLDSTFLAASSASSSFLVASCSLFKTKEKERSTRPSARYLLIALLLEARSSRSFSRATQSHPSPDFNLGTRMHANAHAAGALCS